MYSTVTTVNNMYYIVYLKVAKRIGLKRCHPKKKTIVTVCGNEC